MALASTATRTDRPAAPPSRRRRRGRGHTELTALLFLLPVLILIVATRFVPVAQAIRQSLQQNLPGSTLPAHWAGGHNYATLLHSHQFWSSIQQTLIFNVIVNPLQIVIALALAVLLIQGLPATGLWRTLIFLPAAIPLTGSAIVWGVGMRPDGPLNGLLGVLGIPGQRFLTSPHQALMSIVIIASWIGIGYWMLFLIAGLRDVPGVYYEAAHLDGAGRLRTFFSITLPLIRRPLLFVLVADTVANFSLFAPVQILTNGGPQASTDFLMYDVYRNAYVLSDPYTAAAELLVLVALMLIIVGIQFRLLKSTTEG